MNNRKRFDHRIKLKLYFVCTFILVATLFVLMWAQTESKTSWQKAKLKIDKRIDKLLTTIKRIQTDCKPTLIVIFDDWNETLQRHARSIWTSCEQEPNEMVRENIPKESWRHQSNSHFAFFHSCLLLFLHYSYLFQSLFVPHLQISTEHHSDSLDHKVHDI